MGQKGISWDAVQAIQCIRVDTDRKMPGTQSHSFSLQDSFHGILKKKEEEGKKNSTTFQGNKSPCDSDCLFNNIKPKKEKKKILLENCPMIVYLLKMIRFDHQEVEIWAIRCLRQLHRLPETRLQWFRLLKITMPKKNKNKKNYLIVLFPYSGHSNSEKFPRKRKKNKTLFKRDGKSIEMACSFMCSDIWRLDEVLLADITSKAFI